MSGTKWSYEAATASAMRTISAIVEESRSKPDEQNQSAWDLAHGALRAWSDFVGDDALPADRAQLEELFEALPIRSGAGEWQPSPVVVLGNPGV